MGPKKKQPKNAFYFFVMEFKDQMARKGVIYPNHKEAFDAAGPEWQRLSKDQRNRYESIAKEYKLAEQQTVHKYTTTGKTFEQVDQEIQERQAAQARMETEIKTTVAVLDKKGLQTKIFYFMHVNYYCRVEEKQFIPCELAICQFNFALGAFNFYHTLINPGELPLGYAFEAKKRSDETHQIPLPPPSSAEKNYSKILLNVVKFMKDDVEDGKFPPIYTYGTDGTSEAVKDVLDALCEYEAMQEYPKVQVPENFRVYPLPKLFFELRNKAGDFANRSSKAFPVESLAARELEKNLYSFTPGICCEMHDGTDASQYCSLSLVRRWSFIISDHCCKDLGIELAPGQHIPPPITQQQPRRTQAQIMPEKDDKKSPDPIVPSIIDYSKIRSRSSSSRQLIPDEEEKKRVEPIIPTIIDYSQSKMTRASAVASSAASEKIESCPIGRGRTIAPNFSGVVRRPKSVGLAMQHSSPPSILSEKDFPAIGGSSSSISKSNSNTNTNNSSSSSSVSSSSGLILGQTPLKVAGRGSSVASWGNVPSRGRGLCTYPNK
ncbi:protein maelstrom homolog [Schistocerca piceifrons]|uniref:protein maelstrom homolog n=1 Tax=Schistocerca piceifrons TaxID=274613 RepID=UPI001F5E8837|nr:protein maelstrom homolog [Schistocerca piceifrons]XP_047115468.1 protein maelstrom homolog [Schistocerca piceifrons]